jgi:predicted 3-demethylubiquinone-9 3-methyltransferase (glyoxalase superfamily)
VARGSLRRNSVGSAGRGRDRRDRGVGNEISKVKGVHHANDGDTDHALPVVRFTEAVSFQIHCETQQEIDYFWGELAKGGEEGPCGWLKDKFGLSWQVIPTALPQMLIDENSDKAQRVMKSMLQMRKIDLDALKRAQAA